AARMPRPGRVNSAMVARSVSSVFITGFSCVIFRRRFVYFAPLSRVRPHGGVRRPESPGGPSGTRFAATSIRAHRQETRIMPERKTLARAVKDRRDGKAPSTQAGEFVKEEMDHIREGKHGARSAKQAIAIGLSKARRAGVPLPPPS